VSRVLIVDDEPKLVSFVQRALNSHGIGADGALEGVRGLELALTGMYELVILDMLMPGHDGTLVLEKTMERLPRQQILILSALSDLETRLHCFALGAADYLIKPFALAELLARVRVCLRSNGSNGSERAESTYSTAGITLDVQHRSADVGAGPISMSEREFQVLQYLLSRVGEVCSREEILADVWGLSFDPGTNIVNVVVARLRSKLGPFTVETVRNVGYSIPG
jgi:DNA-binding response OmpR family regulator